MSPNGTKTSGWYNHNKRNSANKQTTLEATIDYDFDDHI
jgi:hypothetical protein